MERKAIMPTYIFKNTKTEELVEMFLSMSDREAYLLNNPDMEPYIDYAPPITDTVRMGMHKPDDSFRDILRNIKHHHHGTKVNTF